MKSAGVLAVTPFVGRVAGANSKEPKNKSTSSKRVVGYYPSWAGDYTPQDVPYDKITHLNYAFLEPKSNGEVKLAVTGDADPDLLKEFRDLSHTRDTSLMFSISSGWYSGRFSDAALTAETRKRFARTATELMRTYNFDGLDIDWEYPDGTIRKTDPHHLTLLLREIRRHLDAAEQTDNQTYELSMAAAPIPSNIDPLEVDNFSDYIDFINVMNYDFHGGWSDITSFNAPLYPAPDAPNTNPVLTANHSMMYWAEQPIPRRKLSFGLPFYGRTFKNVKNEGHGLFQPFEGAGARGYWDIHTNVKPETDYNYHWHPKSRVPWLYSPEEDVFISYDDEHSIKEKTKYVVDNGFGGMMCWELSQDPSNSLLSVINTHISHP